jgi:hypothetical protein
MAHTCGLCGLHDYHYIAIDENGIKVKVRPPGRYASNHSYRHDCSGWKTSTKAEKQYLRHPKRIDKIIH